MSRRRSASCSDPQHDGCTIEREPAQAAQEQRVANLRCSLYRQLRKRPGAIVIQIDSPGLLVAPTLSTRAECNA